MDEGDKLLPSQISTMSIRCGFRRVPAISQARSFFSLPDLLGGGSSKSGEEQTYREQKILPSVPRCPSVDPRSPTQLTQFVQNRYTQEQLYSIVSNVPSYKSFLPFCTSSTIVDGERPQLDEPFEIEAELKVGFMSFEESYVSRVSGEPFRSVKVGPSTFFLPNRY